jgi:hypothetical protein
MSTAARRCLINIKKRNSFFFRNRSSMSIIVTKLTSQICYDLKGVFHSAITGCEKYFFKLFYSIQVFSRNKEVISSILLRYSL